MAERTRFELVDRIAPIVGLANRWFQPLTHLSLPGGISALATAKLMLFYSSTKFFPVFLIFFLPKLFQQLHRHSLKLQAPLGVASLFCRFFANFHVFFCWLDDYY